MTSKALGLIETYGYTPAVEAADICTKTANVELIGITLVGGGLVTVKICGEVSAVKASIDAGAAAASKVGMVISIDVIARLGIGLEKIIYSDESDIKSNDHQPDMTKQTNKYISCDLVDRDTTLEDSQQNIEENLVSHKEDTIFGRTISYNGNILSEENIRLLDGIRVVDLRKIARQIEDFPIERTKIKYAKKDELINAIKNYLKKKGD